MRTIIAGTDFTQSSLNACRYAAFLANKLNCKLTVFNLYLSPVIHSNMGLYGISGIEQRQESVNETNKFILQLQREYPKLKIESFVTSGSFDDQLENFTSRHRVEAAVMGLESKDRISKFIYGSHGVNLAGKIAAPVIIVPQKYKKFKLSKIVLAVDNTGKLYRSSLKELEQISKTSKAAVSLLHVRTPDEVISPEMKKVKVSGKAVAIETHRAKSVSQGIKVYCKQVDADLVTIISRKHSVFYNLFNESVTKEVAFAANVPVMALHE